MHEELSVPFSFMSMWFFQESLKDRVSFGICRYSASLKHWNIYKAFSILLVKN